MFWDKFKKYIIFIFVAIILFYIIFQFKIFFIKPKINIENFENGTEIVINSSQYLLKGNLENSKLFTINSHPVFLDTDSNFSKKLYLSEYQNTYILESVSKTNVKTQKIITIFVQSK